jgi:hypothetical protein
MQGSNFSTTVLIFSIIGFRSVFKSELRAVDERNPSRTGTNAAIKRKSIFIAFHFPFIYTKEYNLKGKPLCLQTTCKQPSTSQQKVRFH